MSVFMKRGAVVAVIAALSLSATCMAQDLRTVGGPMRGSMVLGNLLSTRAMGMGGASIAIEGPRSLNPASLGWTEKADVQITGMQADFNAGPETRYTLVEATVPVDLNVMKGGVKLMGAAISSGTADNKLGFETHMWGREAGFEFGFGLNDRFSIGGAGFPSDPSEVRMKAPFGTVTGRAQSQIGSIRFGSLMRVITEEDDLPGKLNVAGMYTHVIDEWKARGLPAGSDDDDTAYVNVWSVAGVQQAPAISRTWRAICTYTFT